MFPFLNSYKAGDMSFAKVPIDPRQYSKRALVFFPLEAHHLLVELALPWQMRPQMRNA